MNDNNTDREVLRHLHVPVRNVRGEPTAYFTLGEDAADTILAAGFRRQPEAVTDEKVEAAARAMYTTGTEAERTLQWKRADPATHVRWRSFARAALIAASQTGGETP